MKTVFDKSTRDELVRRISLLHANSAAQWGTMNVYQALRHCILWEEMSHGEKKYKRVFIGKLFGRMALKSVLKDESPLRHNSPTVPEMIIKEKEGDIEQEKTKWIKRIRDYEHFSNPEFIHPFFGAMTTEQIGYFAYKHSDHHLRQFNV